MPRDRVILHADMDAFYASIEQRDRPELRGKPVIVGATSARGVVAAASYEARRYGVHSAMPGFEAKRLCPDGIFLASNMSKYSLVSEQIHDVFLEFTPQIEPLALDEAFLDVSGSLGLFGSPVQLAQQLKARVKEVTRLVISVGLAPNKLVAKIACSLGKPDGLNYCPADRIEAMLAPLPVRRLWGVGPVLGQKLEAAGYHTLGSLCRADPLQLSSIVGDRAEPLMALARGEDVRSVDGTADPKSIGEENTFEADVSDRDVIVNALRAHGHSVAKRLRNAGFRARSITLKVKLAKRRTGASSSPARLYPLVTRRCTLDRASSDGKRIGATAVDLWDAAALSASVRLVGVSAGNLERVSATQLDLFTNGDAHDRGERLGQLVDEIQAKFGNAAIGPALEIPEKLTASDRRKKGC